MKTILFMKRNIKSCLIVNYLDLVEDGLTIYWSHIVSDVMGDLVTPEKSQLLWEGDYSLVEKLNLFEISNGLFVSKDLLQKHQEEIKSYDFLLNTASGITPHNDMVIRDRLYHV